jgi:hypothetical protein
VTYAYLRLLSRFRNVSLLRWITPGIQEILTNRELPDDPDFDGAWNTALDIVEGCVLTNDARDGLARTRLPIDDESVDPFLPNSLDRWPVLIVLNALTSAHNEFVRILQQHANIRVGEVSDVDELVRMDPTRFNDMFVRSCRGQIGPDGVPLFDADSERQFVKELTSSNYWIILLPVINCGTTVTSTASHSLVVRFDEQYKSRVGLDEEQRRALTGHVKDVNQGPGLVMFLERVMLRSLADCLQGKAPRDEQTINDYWDSTHPGPLPLLEKTGKNAFAAANNQKRFQLRHLSSVYRFITESAESLLAVPQGNLPWSIMCQFAEKLKLVEGDIGQQAHEDCPGRRSLIVKIVVDMRNNGVENDQDRLMPAIKKWLELYVDTKRTMLSGEERRALDDLKRQLGEAATWKDLVEHFPKDTP